MTSIDRDVEGQTTAITVFSTTRWWGKIWLPILFVAARRIPLLTRILRELRFIGFARWCLIRELPYNGPPQEHARFRHQHLFFESNFNGSWKEYIEAFSRRLASGMRAFWGSSYGFPGAQPVEPFMDYIAAHETEVDHYYVAYDATTTQVLRALELTSISITPERGSDPEVSGQARAFMAMTPIKPGEANTLMVYLRGLGDSPFSRLPRTHMARLVVVSDMPVDPAWGPDDPDHLDLPYLVFTSNFDGDEGSYLDEVAAMPEARDIWGRCVGCPGPVGAPLKDYLLHNKIQTGLFFAAYGDATVAQVRDALERYPATAPEWVSDTPAVRVHVTRAVELARDAYHRAYIPGTLARRDQHANELRDGDEVGSTIRGRLRVRVDEVSVDMRRGLFCRDAEYDVVARFSPNQRLPRLPFFREPIAVALKVLDVVPEGGGEPAEQDLIFGGIDRFFATSAEDGVDLVKAQASGPSGVWRYVFPSVSPRRWRLREAGILLRTLTQLDANPLAVGYNTQVALSCGVLAVKGALEPQTPDPRPWWRRLSRRPRRAMETTLRAGSATFDLMLQRQGAQDPIDDPTVRWTGDWARVATVEFPSQQLGTGEHLIFTLAHTLPQHTAKGQIAELRMAVYADRSADRTRINAGLDENLSE